MTESQTGRGETGFCFQKINQGSSFMEEQILSYMVLNLG
jgi:hypothetical protein